MPAPYDYTINIPQPPAQNFLQSLLGIQQLKGLQQQQDIQAQQAQFAQQQQPLQLQQLQAQIDASKASAAGQSVITATNQLTLDQRKQVGSALDAFNKDPETGVMELAKVAPYMDSNAKEGIGKAIQFWIGKQINDTLDSGKEVTPEQYQKFSNSLNLVPTNEQEQARNAILSMPQNLQTFTKSGVVGITNAALNGNRDAAINASDETAQALNSSNHPAAQATARLFDKMTNQLKDETVDLRRIPISALNVSALVQDKDFHTTLLNTLKENAVIQKGEAEKSLPSAVIEINQSLENKAKAFESSSLELKNAADSLKQFSGGTPESGKMNEMFVKAKGLFTSQPEIPIRNELQRVVNLGGLGAEAQAQGGVLRSNGMVNLAIKYIPDVWKNPEAAIEKALLTAEVKDRMAKVFRAEAEWNSQFLAKQNATKDADVAGVSVSKGQSKSNFINAVTENLFPENEVVNTPALNNLIGPKGLEKSIAPAPTKTGKITETSDLTEGTINLGGGNTATFKLKK